MNYVEAKKTPEGNLRLVLLPEAREDALELHRREVSRDMSTSEAEAEVLESLIGNGFHYVEARDVGALTDAPMIADEIDEDLKPIVGSSVYAFMDYQVRSIVGDLVEKGEAFFVGARVERK